MLLWPIRSALFMDCIQCDGAANRYLRPTVLQFLSTNQLARRTFSLSTCGFQAMLPQTDYACFWTIKSELSAGLLRNKCQLTSQRWANSCPRMVVYRARPILSLDRLSVDSNHLQWTALRVRKTYTSWCIRTILQAYRCGSSVLLDIFHHQLITCDVIMRRKVSLALASNQEVGS